MASFDKVSLAGVRGRLIGKQIKKRGAQQKKLLAKVIPTPFINVPIPRGLPLNGRATGGRQMLVDAATGFDIPTTLVPGPGPGPGPGTSGLDVACNLLTGTARDICLLGSRTFFPQEGGAASADCPNGQVRVGANCVDFSAALPGGDPFVSPATMGAGVATLGAFGLPALTPQGVSRIVRRCGRGMVLGVDNLCYPKGVLGSRSKFRKWRRPIRPPISRRDVRAITRAAAAKDRVAELARDVGLKVGPKRKKSGAHKH